MHRMFSDIDLSRVTFGKYEELYKPKRITQVNTDFKGRPIYKRNYEMFLMYSTGSTLQEIGNKYELTKERVRQILLKIHRQFKYVIKENII